MAERRMFAKTIIDSDAFLTLPTSTQALYFHLSVRGDDEGFVNKPKSVMRTIGANDDDLKLLVAKNFIIPFESGIIVIKHWKIHNYIRGDRIKETVYQEEKAMIEEKENGAYTLIGKDYDGIELIEQNDYRKLAYKKSSLPYSFEYKIRNHFNGKKCPICGCIMGLGEFGTKLNIPSIQHNIPLVKGGEHELYNISVICRSCNVSIQDNETSELNNLEVIEAWDLICQSNVGQMSAQVRLVQERIGQSSKEEESIEKEEVKKKAAKKSPLNLIPLVEQSELTPLLQETLKEWLEYKQEKKEPYTEVGFKKTLTIIKKNVGLYGEQNVIDLINISISNNWKGIIWDKLKERENKCGIMLT